MKKIFPLLFYAPFAAVALTLNIGPGHEFDRIEDALEVAYEGDTLAVYPRADGAPYLKTALLVNIPITLRAMGEEHVTLDGEGFNYSGAGNVPRAIVQFDPGSSGSVLDGFVLQNARNESGNGAGVRINQADNVTITNCVMRGCDTGVMSNGGPGGAAVGQLLTHCVITQNGAPTPTGYSNNLYLGGAGVTLRHCEISEATDAHNVKSRAHHLRVEDCVIRHAANREFDIVDQAGVTDVPGADLILLRNKIIKKPGGMAGNKNLVHFGTDGGAERIGTIYAVSNLLDSTYISPLFDLSSRVGVRLEYNEVENVQINGGKMLSLRHPEAWAAGRANIFPAGYDISGYVEDPEDPDDLQDAPMFLK